MSSSHLEKLNTAQRHAVEYGGPAYADAGPLLIIAGAASGKTNTLAHRVAHLILNGVDPRRIVLLTFSRRAATEMTRRVERIAAQVLGDKAGAMTGGLNWSGTFHAIGARLLRGTLDLPAAFNASTAPAFAALPSGSQFVPGEIDPAVSSSVRGRRDTRY